MDYTVGSLADLITGSNTPNKPKVIQKGFTPVKTTQKENDQNDSSPRKKSKKRKTEDESVNEHLPAKKIKLKKKKKTNNAENSEVKSEVKEKKKTKKQKTEKSNPNEFVDSDEESSAKTIELSENDINAERRIKAKAKQEKKQMDPVDLSKTLFVGNVPIKTSKKKVQRFFKQFGEIEAIRIRGIPVADPKVPKKTAAIKKEFHPNRNSVLCYVRFKNPEDVIKAEVKNGTLFEGHHLRVHRCDTTEKPDETKAIFVGNLSFDAEEDELWKLFESCGPIDYVRIIRDTYSGMGKGIAYVNFKESDAVQLALEMEGVKLKNRELRVSLCNVSGGRKNKRLNKKRKINKPGKPKARKPFNKSDAQGNSGTEENGQYVKQNTFKKQYQGSQFTDKKKKHKVNKGLLEKKKKIKRIAPKSILESGN